ncbi:MAG: hypothetical protein LAO51_08685 [Acidobacteriia bacterium]|nr:hypothetical protein [Terriglobia bacterium]
MPPIIDERDFEAARDIRSHDRRRMLASWVLLIVVFCTALALSSAYSWCWIAVAILVFHTSARLLARYSRSWRRLHFPAMRIYAGAAGWESGRSQVEGREFDLQRAIGVALAALRPHWKENRIRDFINREVDRRKDFADKPLIGEALRRRYPAMPEDARTRILESVRRALAENGDWVLLRLIVAGLLENDLGADARGDYLVTALTTKLAF